MKVILAKGEKLFKALDHIPTPPQAEVINCQIDNPRLFPSFIDQEKALVHGYFTMSICYSHRRGDEEKSYQVCKKDKCLVEIVPLTWEREKPRDITSGDLHLEITPTKPWQCQLETGAITEDKEWGLAALAASLFHPRPNNLKVAITGTISVAVFQQEKKASSPREAPYQELFRQGPPAPRPRPDDPGPSHIPPVIPTPPPKGRGARGKPSCTEEGGRKILPSPFISPELSSTKKVGDIPTITRGKKPEASYLQVGKAKSTAKSWPDYTKIYPPPPKPKKLTGETARPTDDKSLGHG